jgi:hypothetical protein
MIFQFLKMKKITFLLMLLLAFFQGFSQHDPDNFFAESRLDYYTDEEVGEILVFIPERYKSAEMSIDLVFEYEPLNRNYMVNSSGVSTVPFPMELLKEGQNELTVSFNENEKWLDSRKVYVTIRHAQDNAVKIDRINGGLFTDGMVMIPFGFFTYFPVDISSLDNEAINGFNMISPYQKADKKSLKSRKAYMDRCAETGMRVNYNICSVAGGGGAESSLMEGLSPEDKKKMLRKEIETFRDHPALLSWFIADMPDSRSFPADSLTQYYDIIKELDPYHPVTILISSPRNVSKYSQVADIMMTAPYPVPQGSLREVKDYISIPKNALQFEKPVWSVPQAFGGNEWWQREPTPHEIRAMTYMAIIYGATGIQYFIRSAANSFPKSVATWNECATISREIAELAPEFFSQHSAPVFEPSEPGIHVKAFNRSGLVTVLVVNEKKDPGKIKLKMTNGDLTISTTVLFENRDIVMVAGVLEDYIDGYGTRIYRFDTRQMTDPVKELEPGNLVVDPDFEDLSNVGVPSACYAYNGDDPANTFFIDSRRHYSKDHSLRLNNPSDKPGNRLAFFGLELDAKKSYSVSIMARTGASSNKAGGKKGGPVTFRLALGTTEEIFECSESWNKYQLSGILASAPNKETGRVCPELELTGKGTAWFDLLQVYPDMKLVESPGTTENLRNIEVTCIHPDTKIYYTTDGSEPTSLSTLYLVPVEIDKAARFKAKAFKGEALVGYIER